MSVDKMSVDKMSIDEMSVDEMPVDEIPVDSIPEDWNDYKQYVYIFIYMKNSCWNIYTWHKLTQMMVVKMYVHKITVVERRKATAFCRNRGEIT